MHSFCLLASMELILSPNCSLLHLHSEDINSLNWKCFPLKKGISMNIIKTQIKWVGKLNPAS